jgi:hypothetical protein
MNDEEFEKAFNGADEAVFVKAGRRLSDVEVAILRGAWQGDTYPAIAQTSGYSADYVGKDIGPKLWKLLSEALGEKVSKTNFQQALLRPVGKEQLLDEAIASSQSTSAVELESSEGPVALDSPFYVERVPYESQCYEEILRPGCLIRLKAPQQMGKTLLLERVLCKAREQGYQTLTLDFQLADSTVLTDYQKFLQWLCANSGDSLELENRVDEYWKDMYGLNKNCTRYFQRYLLAEINSPLVVGLDNVDLVFEQPALFNDFCRLLRGWYDQARQSDRIGEIWKKIRFIVVHSTEVYRAMDINSSPLAGVGLTVELPEFSLQQVQDLAQQYGLNWNASEAEQLMAMVGGHPALVRKAFDCIKNQNVTLEQLLKTAPTEEGVFRDHLGRQLQNLRQHRELEDALLLCVTSLEPVEVDSELAFKLHSMGLVKLQGNCVMPRCDLYRQYFRVRLNT